MNEQHSSRSLVGVTYYMCDDEEEVCVRESRITTRRDARFRKLAGASLCTATLVTTALVEKPHYGIVGLALNASCFGFLQGVFHQ